MKPRWVILSLTIILLAAGLAWKMNAYSQARKTTLAYKDLMRGINFLSKGQKKSAFQAFDKATAIAPSRFDTCTAIAATLLSKEMYKESIPYFERAIAIPPGGNNRPDATMDNIWDSEIYVSIGGAYCYMGKIEEAEDAYRRALKLNPDNPTAHNDWGYMYADRGIKLDEALILTKRAAEMRPNEGAFVDSLGWALFKKGKYPEALKTLIEAAKLSPSEPEIRYHLGMAYEAQGQPDDAIIEYSKALLLSPSHKPTLDRIHHLYKK